MGIELDVLTGHPGHDLLFVATQVARAAGLKNPSSAVGNFKASKACSMHRTIGETIVSYSNQVGEIPKAANGRAYHAATSLLDEPMVYQMLLRSRSPASEPFRKWVTEEVLPTIRKTGRYDAEQSTNPIAQSVMDELKTLRGEVGELKTLLETLVSRPLVMESAQKVSLYLDAEVHTERVWRHFNRALLVELCELKNLSAPIADKLKPAVLVSLGKQRSRRSLLGRRSRQLQQGYG